VTKKFVVIYEAQADFTVATELADRVLLHEIDWLDVELLQFQRQWIGEEPPGSRLTWRSIPGRAREAGIRVHGQFNGEPGLPDSQAARRTIAYVLRKLVCVDAILLIRDVDDQGERKHGLEQARAVYASECTIILGVAIRERESWVVCGFQPSDEKEKQRLATESQSLGWNPCLESHRLTAGKDDQALKSPKRVLQVLTGGDRDREAECWRNTSLSMLAERGQHNGLADFLKEVRNRLAPLL